MNRKCAAAWSPMPGCKSSRSGCGRSPPCCHNLECNQDCMAVKATTESMAFYPTCEASVQALMNTCSRPGSCWNSQCMLQCAATLGQSLWQELLSRVRTDPTLSATNYQINSAVHRAKLRAWQALAVLSAFIPAQPASTGAAIDQLWPYLQVCTCCLPVCYGMSSIVCE